MKTQPMEHTADQKHEINVAKSLLRLLKRKQLRKQFRWEAIGDYGWGLCGTDCGHKVLNLALDLLGVETDAEWTDHNYSRHHARMIFFDLVIEKNDVEQFIEAMDDFRMVGVECISDPEAITF